MNPIQNFLNAMRNAGISTDYIPQGSGNIERFHIEGDKPRTKNGWCVLFLDGDRVAGQFGNWKTGQSQSWCSFRKENMTQAERDEMHKKFELAKKQRQQQQKEAHLSAKEKAKYLWSIAKPANADHPYLVKKNIGAYVRQLKDNLFVPVMIGSEICSLQFISLDGEKKFLSGGEIAGGCFVIGEPSATICIAEGYATGCSIYEATGYETITAFNSGNLLAVAQAVRHVHGESKIILCADDDAWTDGNPGLTKAREAAKAIRGYLAVPDFSDCDISSKPTDFNDMHQLVGLEEVRRAIVDGVLVK